MVEFEDAIAVLKANQGFIPNKYEDSFYRVYSTPKGKIQIRVSNHGTELWTWIKNAPIDPSECYMNVSIVLSNDGNHLSNTNAEMRIFKTDDNGNNILGPDGKRIVIGKRDDFEIIQYVYNLSILTPRNMAIINAKISETSKWCKFYEPLQTNSTKHAKVYKLQPNKPEETIIMENYNYMKTNVKRINESQLRAIIAESVKKVLNEDYNFSSDFEDGGNAIDRDIYNYGQDNVERWAILSQKQHDNDNYESLRYNKASGYDSGTMDFVINMLNKGFWTKGNAKDIVYKVEDAIKEATDILFSYIVDPLESSYEKSGDERYLVALQGFFELLSRRINPPYEKYIDIIYRGKYKNYTPLDKNYVYDYDSETHRYDKKPANIRSRRNKE